jgi:tetratricopeptide (TPR) repeat protein
MRLTVLLVCVLTGCGPKKLPESAAAPPTTLQTFSAPADARAWYLKATVAELQGDYAEAERALAWVIRLDRTSPWAWAAKGRLMASTEKWDASVVAFSQAFERASPPNTEELSTGLCELDDLVTWIHSPSLGVRGPEYGVLQEVMQTCGELE